MPFSVYGYTSELLDEGVLGASGMPCRDRNTLNLEVNSCLNYEACSGTVSDVFL